MPAPPGGPGAADGVVALRGPSSPGAATATRGGAACACSASSGPPAPATSIAAGSTAVARPVGESCTASRTNASIRASRPPAGGSGAIPRRREPASLAAASDVRQCSHSRRWRSRSASGPGLRRSLRASQERVDERATAAGQASDVHLLAAELAPQADAPPGDQLRGGLGADVERPAHLGVRPAVDVAQRQRPPLPLAHARRAAPDLHHLVGQQRGALRIALQVPVGAAEARDVVVAHLAAIAQLVAIDVASGRAQVAGDVRVLRLPVSETREVADEGLLREVLAGEAIAAAQAQAVAAQRRLVLGEHRLPAGAPDGTRADHVVRWSQHPCAPPAIRRTSQR